MEFVEQKVGGFGIIQKNEDGSISQIGLTEEQYIVFELLLAGLSNGKSFYKLPKVFDLVPAIK
ncbi:hypothetical protein [Myroides odoratus]|uniref:Uncharacterized protein n=1 Tax=Myroides odoratus TaxID=256 RepID=A0A9Q6Z776_MYROD|nr:hypothetical protein [Myroides odoratus]EHQ41525.1 hypothetical protein Myrod_0689 [Myroides odoratus DSM 2801]EKB02682.1 hypothetical protein HMPREF9716_03711 [Myroides odoratus CIP 103059]QQT98947.1 hypothetical protein I6I88_12065 [Myroides odoratus]WQD58866.1 hypothetical protein U0010_06910 [Myroides odoratus]STZ28788.1 Uncharacterised protein [Myroides odoratus]